MSQVNSPSHYTRGKQLLAVEPIYIAEYLDFCSGNAVKYICRANYKGNRKQDLAKALFYLNRARQNYKNNKLSNNSIPDIITNGLGNTSEGHVISLICSRKFKKAIEEVQKDYDNTVSNKENIGRLQEYLTNEVIESCKELLSTEEQKENFELVYKNCRESLENLDDTIRLNFSSDEDLMQLPEYYDFLKKSEPLLAYLLAFDYGFPRNLDKEPNADMDFYVSKHILERLIPHKVEPISFDMQKACLKS